MTGLPGNKRGLLADNDSLSLSWVDSANKSSVDLAPGERGIKHVDTWRNGDSDVAKHTQCGVIILLHMTYVCVKWIN